MSMQELNYMANLSLNQKAGRLRAAGYKKRVLYITSPTVQLSWCMEYNPFEKVCCWVSPQYKNGNTTHVWRDINRAWDFAASVGDVK